MNFLSLVFLQAGNIRSTFNQILSDYGIPIVAIIIILSAVGGLIGNLDKIMDTEGRGTRKEGFLNVVYIMAGVIVVIVLIGAVVALTGQINISI